MNIEGIKFNRKHRNLTFFTVSRVVPSRHSSKRVDIAGCVQRKKSLKPMLIILSFFILALSLSSNTARAADRSTVYGTGASATDGNGTAYGNNASAVGYSSIAIGSSVVTEGVGSIYIGAPILNFDPVKGNSTIVIGEPVRAGGDKNILIGVSSYVEGSENVSIGYLSSGLGGSTTSVGSYAFAEAKNSVALGTRSMTHKENEVNIGIWGHSDLNNYESLLQVDTRTLSGLSKGVNADEAVNKEQLDLVAANAHSYIDARSRQAEENALTHANSYTNQRVNALKQQVDSNRKQASSGIAGVAAMANIPQISQRANFGIGAAVGNYKGEQGLAIGISARFNVRVVGKASVSATTQHDFVSGAGVLFEW